MSTDTETEVEETEAPKTTRVTFHNPEAGRLPSIYQENEQMAQEHFEAAQYLKERLGPGRQRLFGEFAVAIERLEKEGEFEDFIELCSHILDQNVEVRLELCSTDSARGNLNE